MTKTAFGLSIASIAWLAMSCGQHHENKPAAATKTVVTDSGRTIQLPPDSLTLHFFKTEEAVQSDLNAELMAPAHVAATVVRSSGNAAQNVVLFDNPDLTASYTEMLQHIINIREKGNIIRQKKAIAAQKQIELARFKDLAEHGAGTGKDVSDAKTDLISAETESAIAETDLANEKTSIIEHESKLKLAGFDPQALVSAKADKIWVICEMPENQITKVKEGSGCTLQFNSYPGETFNGTIENVGEVVDNITRMVKLRITISDIQHKLRAGMYATVKFGVSEGNTLSVPRSAVVTVQGKNYVFVKKDDRTFLRREILSGAQVNDRMVVLSGIQPGEQVVTDGSMQLKGLSFGY
ncbi:efflux RND transporter periplasmic adaptor subunit [Chitinophaga qingshengii]|uniref:Efflux RND transporter periplasmic adaptor subunit n=1 Tax=Chitinophaga qingshengii TaxID=1569794 RepID=A0ABR7TR07_9BACT|nr:efflux RND transporter periplasmic adaptor subunit [Chitinophaga qingshengii]MBC9932050.1 efflux RND transporter periplasmic adaptor subunit [Chitinophaga qingshengii]